MKIEINIRTTTTCPACGGKGEVYNPEWQAFGEAWEAWATASPKHTTTEREAFEGHYWRSKGHGEFGPWDFQCCSTCEGDQELVADQYISIGELRALLAIEPSALHAFPVLSPLPTPAPTPLPIQEGEPSHE